MTVRHFAARLGLLGATLGMCFSSVAWAADYPVRPVTLVVPFAAGGTTDIIGRLVAEALGRELGQVVVVENRAGAGGSIGTAYVAAAKPDGYTLGVATVSTHGINPAVYVKLPFDAQRDFQPISNLAAVPNVMAVNPGVPAQDMDSFVKLVKAEPGKYTYASAGNGSVSHMMGELFKTTAGVDMLHVPYRGVGPALVDTLAGQVHVLYDNLPSSLPQIKSGGLRALAVASAARSPAAPDVPTFAELGLEALNEPAWFGLVAPAGIAPDVLNTLHQATLKVLNSEGVKQKLASLGAVPIGDTPEQFAQTIADTIALNAQVAKKAKIEIK